MRALPLLAVGLIGCVTVVTPTVRDDDSDAGDDPGGRQRDGAAQEMDADSEDTDAGSSMDASPSLEDASTTAPPTDAGDAGQDATPVLGDAGSTTGDAAACNVGSLSAQAQPPDISIVLDRSGSMQPALGLNCKQPDINTAIICSSLGIDCMDPMFANTVNCGGTQGTRDRWAPAVSAIKVYTAAFETKVRFSLTLFPGIPANGVRANCTTGTERVPLGLSQAQAIASALDMTKPEGNTPTPATLDEVRKQIEARRAQGNAHAGQYVVLVTDGQATCANSTVDAGTPNANSEAHAATLRALDALSALGVTTYVLGIDAAGDATLTSQLAQYAQHGGSGEAYAVEASTSLSPRLHEITESTLGCDFALTPAPAAANKLRVELEGNPLMLDHVDGYARSGNGIRLRGAACARVRSAGVSPSVSSVCTP